MWRHPIILARQQGTRKRGNDQLRTQGERITHPTLFVPHPTLFVPQIKQTQSRLVNDFGQPVGFTLPYF